jgi:hypothetical protein
MTATEMEALVKLIASKIKVTTPTNPFSSQTEDYTHYPEPVGRLVFKWCEINDPAMILEWNCV